MTFEEHEAYKEKIRSELYARVKTSVRTRSEEDGGPVTHYIVRARTRIPYDKITPTFAKLLYLTPKEYAEALDDLSLLDGYRERCAAALREAVDTYCAGLIANETGVI
jgi:hypothetical protein